MGIKDFFGKAFSKDPDFKNAEKQAKIERLITDRQKSPNLRELERFQTEQREQIIKNKLEQFRKRERRNNFQTGLMDRTNIFKNHGSIMRNGPSVMGKVQMGDQMFFK